MRYTWEGKTNTSERSSALVRVEDGTSADALLLDRQRVRARDGQLVQEHEELAEGLKEGPAGEQADALVGVYGSVWDHLLLNSGEQAEMDLLLLAQQIHWIRLVELDGGSVHLRSDVPRGHDQMGFQMSVPAAAAHLFTGRDG